MYAFVVLQKTNAMLKGEGGGTGLLEILLYLLVFGTP